MRNLHGGTIGNSIDSIITDISIDNATSSDSLASKTLDHYGDLMSVVDLAAFLGVSKQTIYSEIREGKFGSVLKFGREYRVPKVYIVQRYLGGYVGCCEGQL